MSSYKLNLYWDEPEDSRLFKSLLSKDNKIIDKYNDGQAVDDITKKDQRKWHPVKMSFPIMEDFTFQLESDFSSYQDQMQSLGFGIVNKIFDLMNMMSTMGKMGGKLSDSSNQFNFQMYKETKPFTFPIKLQLNTIRNPFEDVYVPALTLSNMTIPSMRTDSDGKFNGTYDTPGVNWSNMQEIIKVHKGSKQVATGKMDKVKEEQIVNGKKKIVTVQKPAYTSAEETDADVVNKFNGGEGSKASPMDLLKSTGKIIKKMTISTDSLIIDPSEDSKKTDPTKMLSRNNTNMQIILLQIDGLYVRSCKPTWSKNRTQSGIPLYCDLDIEFHSMYSANDSMILFNRSHTEQFRKNENNNIWNKAASTVFR